MAKKNRTCYCCNEKYYYCPSCADEFRPSWMVMFDTEDCKTIFQTCSSYNNGSVTKEEAKQIFKDIKFKDFDLYEKSVSDTLKEIYKEDVKVEQNSKDESKENVEIKDEGKVVKSYKSQNKQFYKSQNRK